MLFLGRKGEERVFESRGLFYAEVQAIFTKIKLYPQNQAISTKFGSIPIEKSCFWMKFNFTRLQKSTPIIASRGISSTTKEVEYKFFSFHSDHYFKFVLSSQGFSKPSKECNSANYTSTTSNSLSFSYILSKISLNFCSITRLLTFSVGVISPSSM